MPGSKNSSPNTDVQKIADDFGQKMTDKFMLDRSWSDGSELSSVSSPVLEAAVGAAVDMFLEKVRTEFGKKK
jgi:hypothetical protein